MSIQNEMKHSGMVALVGRPNVGKSTLLNAVLGQPLSIVSPKAQTTRDQIRGILNEEHGQMVFIDTPGVHRAKEGGINEYMVKEVRQAIEGSDVILYMIDPSNKRSAEEYVLEFLKKIPESKTRPMVIVINKADLIDKLPNTTWIQEWVDDLKSHFPLAREVVEISAQRKQGVKELVTVLFSYLPKGPFLFQDEDAATDRPVRFLASELIRRQLFLQLGDEIPYSCAVEIESYVEAENLVKIRAVILVERMSQKGMVVGAQGKKIKSIGIDARKEIEKLVETKVHLELFVKVAEGWSSDPVQLKRMGYRHE